MERDILNVGLKVVEHIGEAARPMGVRELSRALDMPVGNTHRVLQALKRERLVEQAGDRGLYRLGPRIGELSSKFMRSHDLVPTAMPFLHEAVERSGDSVAIMVVDGREAVCAASVEGDQLLRVVFPVGRRGPLYRGASGRILLAFQPEETITAVLRDGAKATGPAKLADSAQVLASLAGIRKRGYAVSHGEREEGITSVAAAIRGPDSTVLASVALYGPSSRFSRAELASHLSSVRECASAISDALTGRVHRSAAARPAAPAATAMAKDKSKPASNGARRPRPETKSKASKEQVQ
jgi:IclR family transcriptional regulator, KDG regulon repressor